MEKLTLLKLRMERLVEFVSGLITGMEKSLNGLHRISLAVLFAIKVGVWVIPMMGITLRTSGKPSSYEKTIYQTGH